MQMSHSDCSGKDLAYWSHLLATQSYWVDQVEFLPLRNRTSSRHLVVKLIPLLGTGHETVKEDI